MSIGLFLNVEESSDFNSLWVSGYIPYCKQQSLSCIFDNNRATVTIGLLDTQAEKKNNIPTHEAIKLLIADV